MQKTARALALLAALLPAIAVAQSQPNLANLPKNTVLGRMGTGAGPAQAIPFATLGPSLITSNLLVTSPLSISGLTLSITGAAGKVLAGTPAAFSATPTLGVASTTSGTLTFANAGNSGTVTLAAPSTSTTYTITFPTTACLSGEGWVSNGSGVMSCAATSGTVNSGTAGQLTYYATTSAAVSGNANLTVSAGALTIGVAGSQAGTLKLSGSSSGTTTLAVAAAASGTLTLPSATDTLVGRATTDTLTNKTLTSPMLTTPALGVATGTSLALGGCTIGSHAFCATGSANVSGATTIGGAITYGGVTLSNSVTGTGAMVLATSPTLVTPALGVASATSINGLTITTSTGTLTIASGKTATVSNTLTLAGTDGTTITFQGTDTYVGRTTTDTLTNKTLTSPTINGGTATALTSLGIRSTGSGAFDLTLANTENLTAGRTLTLTLNNAARTINMSGNLTLAAGFTTAGGSAITLTASGATNITLPTSGTLATQDAVNTFSSANTFTAVNQFTDIKLSSGKIYPTANSTTALQVAKADGTTSILNVDTTNNRIGIGTTTPSAALDVSGTIKFTTLDGTSLGTSPSTVTDLTINNTPTAGNDYIPYYNSSASAIRRATISAIISAATAGVSSINGLSGALTITNGTGITVGSVGSTVTITGAAATATVAGIVKRGRMAIVREAQSSGTAGGDFTSGADRTRVLNNEFSDLDGIVTVASNRITPISGTYSFEWCAPAYKVDQHQSFLYNFTDTTEVARAKTAVAASGDNSSTESCGAAVVTTDGTKAYEIRHRAATTKATNGFGDPSSFGTEVYTQVIIRSYDQ